MDVYHSSDFAELEAARLGPVDNASGQESVPEPVVEVVTKDVTPEQVEQAPAEVTGV